jgi:hypothetical protein
MIRLYIFLLIIIIILSLLSFNNSIGYFEHLENNGDDCPAPVQLKGTEGPQGPPGLSGGIFQRQGPLRNLANVGLVADRLYGTGPSSVPYLADMNYTSHQTWTLESNKLQNQYGNCLLGDNTTNLVYMSGCDSKGTDWIYDSLGRLQFKGNPAKCLTPVYEGLFKCKRNEQIPPIKINRLRQKIRQTMGILLN